MINIHHNCNDSKKNTIKQQVYTPKVKVFKSKKYNFLSYFGVTHGYIYQKTNPRN